MIALSKAIHFNQFLTHISVDCEYSEVHSFFSKMFSDISLRLNVTDDDMASRLHNTNGSANLANHIDRDLEQIIATAIKLHAKHAPRFILHASPFAPRPKLVKARPPVILQVVPPAVRKPLHALRYRFEGVRSMRRAKRRRTIGVAVVVVLTLTLLFWKWWK
jgi:hypothetical protein